MSAAVHGHHLEAFMRQENFYRSACGNARALNAGGPISVLDYGCGAEKGVSRTILENVLEQRDKLHLFDTEEVRPSKRPNTRVISEALIWTANPVRNDIVNLSYVLCLLEPSEAKTLLSDLKQFQPWANFSIVDYTLANNTRAEVLALLNSNEEQKWKDKLGEAEFLRTHMRFSPESLEALVESAGLHVQASQPLDNAHMRHAIVASGR